MKLVRSARRGNVPLWLILLSILSVRHACLGANSCKPSLIYLALPIWQHSPKSALTNHLQPKQHPVLADSPENQYRRYLVDSYRGLDAMRGENGLVMDTVHLRQSGQGKFIVEKYKTASAPTDTGLDLMAQVGMSLQPGYEKQAQATLERSLATLERLPFHEASGLFYRLYETSQTGSGPIVRDISSVDNLHLALGLWTVAETFAGTSRGEQAKRLFARMDFSAFFDGKSGLVGGNLKAVQTRDGYSWELEPYRYHFGSEARAIYTVGFALGLFRQKGQQQAIQNALKQIPIEVSRKESRDRLTVWDGGVFQALLPHTLIGEDRYSHQLSLVMRQVGQHIESHGPEVLGSHGVTIRLPAAHSASVSQVNDDLYGGVDIEYEPHLGLQGLKATANATAAKQHIVAFHAVLLGATTDPHAFAPRLSELEPLTQGSNQAYLPDFGWVDSVGFKTDPAGPNGAVPHSAGVGVDKGIDVVSLLQILDAEGMSPSARSLWANPTTRARLQKAYRIIDERWEQSRSPK